jgi:hypothetical protein
MFISEAATGLVLGYHAAGQHGIDVIRFWSHTIKKETVIREANNR